MYALTEIKGVGRRYANIVCKKADVDLNKRSVLVTRPLQFHILNRLFKTGLESSLSGTANDILKRNGEYLPQNAAVVDFDIGELVLHPLECQNRGGMGRMGRLDDG